MGVHTRTVTQLTASTAHRVLPEVSAANLSPMQTRGEPLIIIGPEHAAAIAADVRGRAHALGREIGILGYGFMLVRDTEQEAREAFEQLVAQGDWGAARNIMRVLGMGTPMVPLNAVLVVGLQLAEGLVSDSP